MATYTVQAGDTLGAIAERFGTTALALQQRNHPNIPNVNVIRVGQVIDVPNGQVIDNGVSPAPTGDKNPWEHFSSATIAAACDARVANIEANWPDIHWALSELGISGRLTQAAAIATVRLETGSRFEPIEEIEGPDSRWDLYEGGRNYHGRGYIQLTHLGNYRAAGNKPQIQIDLVNQPDRALEKSVSAWALAHYFRDRGTSAAAERRDWVQVRVSVLGGPQPGAIERIVERLGV